VYLLWTEWFPDTSKHAHTNKHSWASPVNEGAALFGGSHINYVDYDRELFAKYMDKSGPANKMVVGMGQHIKRAYNVKNELISRRVRGGRTPVGAHLSNTNAAGEWVVAKVPRIEYDWFYQSLCSAHLEEAQQWGGGIGFVDDMFITNEEWHEYTDNKTFVGNTYHALDLKTSTMHAMGATSFGGFEKSAEINSQNPNYVMLAMSGTCLRRSSSSYYYDIRLDSHVLLQTNYTPYIT
jgi:hypothetical protein